jgi:AbrB family looped-hinge helix DNA binding protein
VSAISRKNQITIPKDVLADSGLSAGDDVQIVSRGPGRVELVKSADLVEELAGSLDESVYPSGYLDDLRDGWE